MGPDALDEAELWAVILGSGTKGFSVLDIGKELSSVGFEKLADLSVEEISKIPGVGKVKALTIKAVLELCKRHHLGEERPKITSPKKVEEIVRPLIKGRKEHLFVLSLSISQTLLSVELVAVGSLNTVNAPPREIFAPILRSGGYYLVLVHNHPDGEAEPSREDITFTERICKICRLLGLELLDHVILGERDLFSFRENRLLDGRC